MLTFSKKSDTSHESFDGKFSESPEAQKPVTLGCGQLNLLPESVGVMLQPLLDLSGDLLPRGKLLQGASCSGWQQLCSHSSCGWPCCQWCRRLSCACLHPPLPPPCTAEVHENWPHYSIKCFIFEFCQTTRVSEEKKKRQRMGYKCLSMSDWIIVK